MIKELIKPRGRFHFKKVYKSGEIEEFTINNLLTDDYLDSIRDSLQGDYVGDLEIMYLALGDGTTAPAISDTILENEILRIVTGTKTKETGKSIIEFSLGTGDALFDIKEIGIFADSTTATASADSGVLTSRINVDIIKSTGEPFALFITREDIIERG